MALDLYLRHPATGPQDPEVVALSALLNRLPYHKDRPAPSRFRNPNGVYMKLQNFRRWDPDDNRAGLRRGSRLEEEVWKEFSARPSRRREAVIEITSTIREPKAEEQMATEGNRIAHLDPDIARIFTDDAIVNKVLRQILELAAAITEQAGASAGKTAFTEEGPPSSV